MGYHIKEFLSLFLKAYQVYGVVWGVKEDGEFSYHISFYYSKKAALRSVLRKSKQYGEAFQVQSCVEINPESRQIVRFEVITPAPLNDVGELSLFIWGELSSRTSHLSFIRLYTTLRLRSAAAG